MGAELESHDLDKQRLTEAELKELIGDRDYKEFLNTRNELYRSRKMKDHPPARAAATTPYWKTFRARCSNKVSPGFGNPSKKALPAAKSKPASAAGRYR